MRSDSRQTKKRKRNRMLEAAPLLATTLVFISIFAYSYANLELENIKANWNERRCEPLVMIVAALLPLKPGQDVTEFAIDNFQFCLGSIIDSSISIFLSPMMQLFGHQLDATKTITDSMNYLKKIAATLLKPLNDLFNTLWGKLMVVIYQSARIFYKLYSSMDRIFGIATASIFAGMSMFKAIQNAMGFVIQVIIAILIILCVLVIFLFFVMWPVIPLILTMIGILSTTVYAANVSGMSGNFCVAPWTMVKVKSGYKRVSELVSGEELDDGVIEGILKVESITTDKIHTSVNIDGITMSKTHLIKHDGKWIMAGAHPLALPPTEEPGILYCLNTSTRVWTVKGTEGDHALLDWEELPESDSNDLAWEALIYRMLNEGTHKPLKAHKHSSPGRGLFGEDTIVYTLDSEKPISKVTIGDRIRDKSGYTRVIGIYQDTSELVPRSGPNAAVWSYSRGWTHPNVADCLPKTKRGYQLVTESGTFIVESNILVRDFTEVGADRIHETYSFTQSAINIASF